MPRNRKPHRLMSPSGQINDFARNVQQELTRDSEILAQRITGELPIIDNRHVTQAEYHAYIRSMWDQPGKGVDTATGMPHQFWREDELERVGPKQFWEEAHRAFGLVPKRPSAELLGEGLHSDQVDLSGRLRDVMNDQPQGPERATKLFHMLNLSTQEGRQN